MVNEIFDLTEACISQENCNTIFTMGLCVHSPVWSSFHEAKMSCLLCNILFKSIYNFSGDLFTMYRYSSTTNIRISCVESTFFMRIFCCSLGPLLMPSTLVLWVLHRVMSYNMSNNRWSGGTNELDSDMEVGNSSAV